MYVMWIGFVAKEKGQCSLVFAKVANDDPIVNPLTADDEFTCHLFNYLKRG